MIKKLTIVALSALLLATPAWAQDKAEKAAVTPKTIMIDVQRIMAESEAAKNVRDQVGTLRKNLQDDINKQETALREEEQSLVKQQGSLPQADFDKKRKSFEDKVNKTRRTVNDKVSALDAAVNRATEQIEQELQKVLFDLAKAQGADLVLPKQAILVATTGMDFTDQALADLNKRITKVDVKVGAAPAANNKKDDAKKDKK